MAKEDISRKLEQFRRFAASANVNNLAAQLRPLLQADFAYWFQTLKEQKLVSQLRSVANISELRRLLLTPDYRSLLGALDLEALEHHFDVCTFMQDVFARIDADAFALACKAAHPENMARAVVRMIEIANYGFQKNAVPKTNELPQRISILQLAHMERQFRDILDTGNIILNSQVARKGADASLTVSDTDLNELVRLAFLYDEMRQTVDLYTYQRGDIRIKRRSLVLTKTDHETNLAGAVGAERTSDHDQIRSTVLGKLEVGVHNECRAIPVLPSDTFFSFLQRVGGTEAGMSARHFGQAFANDLRFEVSGFFDVSTEVVTASGTFTVDELIRAWALLVTIAMLGQKWNERRADIVVSRSPKATSQKERTAGRLIRDIPVPELDRNWLVRILASEAGLSRQQSRRLIEQFASRPAVGRIDLFYKPLLILSGNVVLLPTPYIRGSRFERNLFALIATETDLDQKKKGYLPVLELQRRFQDAGFQAIANFRVQVNHREITDIDLVAFKDGLLFLGQCKIVIEPDSLYDAWKAERKLDFAAAQLNTCLAHLDDVRATLFERLRLKGIKEQRVIPFVLTNTRQFTERRFRSHPVVDIPYLRFVLGGARATVIGSGPGKVGFRPGHSYIKGDYPTGEELAILLADTIHKVQEREITYRHVMRKIGDRRVHVPLMNMRTAGDSHLLVTRDEIFEDDEPFQPWRRT